MFSNTPWGWALFNLFVFVMLALDLGVFHRDSRPVRVWESLGWVGFWVVLALAFNTGVYHAHGGARALEFLTGYLIELSLSVDNLFVFILVFSYFQVPAEHQYKVLFWGIIGTIAMRALFILTGVALVTHFAWITYVFGAFLIYSSVAMLRRKEDEVDLESNWLVRFVSTRFPFTRSYDGGRFVTRISGRRYATPLLLVLLCVESADLIFNLDSIPAILAITRDSFIIYTSNIFAVMGLRSFYFALAGMIHLFHFLNYGLAAILAFIGVKMLIAGFLEIPVIVALLVVAALLAASIVASLVWPKRATSSHEAPRIP